MSEQEWLRTFSRNLSCMMREQGMNQADLAEEAGISRAALCKYLRGERMPKITAVINLADALYCDIRDLVDFNERIEF